LSRKIGEQRVPQQQKKSLKKKKSVHFLDSRNRCAATKRKEKRSRGKSSLLRKETGIVATGNEIEKGERGKGGGAKP
jgi:hypothetical protein